jgi:hypothetical protein
LTKNLFKAIPIRRQTQMTPASIGPPEVVHVWTPPEETPRRRAGRKADFTNDAKARGIALMLVELKKRPRLKNEAAAAFLEKELKIVASPRQYIDFMVRPARKQFRETRKNVQK